MKAVILANGLFPTDSALLDELKQAKFLAVCDGAVHHLENLGIEPSVIVGDLDSIPARLRDKYSQKVIHIKEQESNDLSKTFYHCLSLGFDEFVILGATGKREDHSIANIALLAEFFAQCKRIVIKSDFGEFEAHSLPCRLPSQKGEQISLFCLDPNVALTSEDLKYPLSSLRLKSWAMGTLNEAMGDFFSLKADQEGSVIVYRMKFL